MAVEATYAFNNFVKSQISSIDSAIVFYPGKQVPQDQGKKLITYRLIPATPANLWMINSDTIQYRIIHPDFETVQKVASAILLACNVDFPNTLFTGTTDNGDTISVLHLFVAPGSNGDDFFVDSSKYYYQDMQISLTYKLV